MDCGSKFDKNWFEPVAVVVKSLNKKNTYTWSLVQKSQFPSRRKWRNSPEMLVPPDPDQRDRSMDTVTCLGCTEANLPSAPHPSPRFHMTRIADFQFLTV